MAASFLYKTDSCWNTRIVYLQSQNSDIIHFQLYLNSHKYANAAADDLWEALSKVSKRAQWIQTTFDRHSLVIMKYITLKLKYFKLEV